MEEFKKKRNEYVKGIERLALTRVRKMSPRPISPRLMSLRPTLARLEKPRKKPRKKLQKRDVGTVLVREKLLQLRTITAIRKTIIPSITLSQKISGSLNDP